MIFESSRADVDGVLTHPTECTIQAVNFTFERAEYAILDKAIESDFQYLSTVCEGELEIVNRSLDQNKWIVSFVTDDGPVRYYVYDFETTTVRFSVQPPT